MKPKAFRARRRHVVMIGVGAVVAAAVAQLCFFSVAVSEYAIVTEFGQPVEVITSPGLKVKFPYQSVTRFDNRLFVHTPSLSEFLTLEKTAIVAASAILWRIDDPQKFFETVFNRMGAESRLSDILFAELGAAIGGSPFAAFVSADDTAYRANEIMAEVAARCREIALRDYGIEVVDVRLERLDFPERNRTSVYARMRSERFQISMRYRSEGAEEGVKIRAAGAQEKAAILAEAFKVAEQYRGEGEAEAARIYAESLGKSPEYYDFMRSMEASQAFFDEETLLVLPAESSLFGLLYDSGYYHHQDTLETR